MIAILETIGAEIERIVQMCCDQEIPLRILRTKFVLWNMEKILNVILFLFLPLILRIHVINDLLIRMNRLDLALCCNKEIRTVFS